MRAPTRARTRHAHARVAPAALVAILALAACGGGDDGVSPPPARVVAQVEIVTATPNVLFSDDVQFAAVARDSAGAVMDSVTLAWRAVDESVVTVNAAGLVTGRGTGRTLVIASAGGHADTAAIEVPKRWTDVDAGWGFACALDDDGAAWCWGANGIGQLGNGTGGTTSFSSLPVRVVTDQRFTSIHAGLYTACGLTADGTPWCWGDIVGDKQAATRLPTRLLGSTRFRSLGLGDGNFCGPTLEGELKCWGVDFGGSPVAHGPARGYVQAALNNGDAGGNGSGCALTATGEAWCWGYNGQGSYGTGGFESSIVPARAFPDYAFAQVAAGTAHNCGRTQAGEVRCAGSHGGYGSLGDGSADDYSATPRRASLGQPATQLESDNRGSCAVLADGTVRCWGAFVIAATQPWAVPAVTRAVRLAMGNGTGYALTANGRIWAWGGNDTGQLGDASTARRETPAPVRDRWAL